MRVSITTPKHFLSLAAVVTTLAFATFPSQANSVNAAETKPYEWSAKLVSFDETTNTAVLQERVASHIQIADLDSFTEGDRLILIWSGRSWASGIRDLAADPELTPDTLSLPVEFVSAERDGAYINFRIPVPQDAVAMMASFEDGVRITGTSPRMAADWNNSVLSLRHYNDID